jgi:hypothetical protein
MQAMPAGQLPSHCGGPLPPLHGCGVVGAAHPAPSHASQQLLNDPAHAWPPFGGRHFVALDLIEQRVTPREFVRQHDTAPLRPQVERDAQRRTAPRQLWLTSVAAACSRAQRT